jgi:ATP-binding cassette subfamily F protein 3
VVSHDRRFLKVAVSRIFEVRRTRLTTYSGNYDWYRQQRAMEEQQEWDRYHAQQRRTKAAEQAAEARLRTARSTAVAPLGQRERYGKEHFARKSAKVQKTAKVILARSEREPKAHKPIIEEGIPTLAFPVSHRPPDTVLVADGLAKSYGDKLLFDGLSLSIAKDDRVAISGPNGCGKSTLLKVLLGLIQPDQGSATLGAGVRVGYFAQDAENLNPTESAVDQCLPLHPDSSWVYTLLASLKLPMDQVQMPVSQMSAGERAKVAIARILLLSPNVLVLDEPTNHLDIDAQEAIEETLALFRGPMLFVSHDRSFIERFATSVIELKAQCDRHS